MAMLVISNSYIYGTWYCNDGRARASTGIKGRSIKKEQVDGRDQDWGLVDIGALKRSEKMILNKVIDAITKYKESCARLGEPLKKVDCEEAIIIASGRLPKDKNRFITDYESMIKDMRSGKLLVPRSQKRYASASIDNYQWALNRILLFVEEQGMKLEYKRIDKKWVEKYIQWLTERQLSKNSLAFSLQYLAAFLRRTYDDDKHKNPIGFDKVFNVSSEESDTVAVSIPELETVYRLTTSLSRERARDVFVFGCFVGLRADDLRKINHYILVGDYFEFHTGKSDERVIIPAHPVAKEIWKKYNGNMPVYKYNSGLARGICSVFKQAGIDTPILVAITKGGVKGWRYYPKYDLVSPHTMRRTFATNAIKAGIPTRKVMQFTGHTTEDSFKRYVKLDKKENAEDLASHPFFTTPLSQSH
ncbi:site-specific integrase [Chitinophaga pendula]|uniref:tyrosine-type recombinase/integrase n=1 Tax=Chitinophaga TaxID=79328 RepID=UPI000BAE9E20|nr:MULTISPECIES: phage integrase SAM-like domain-containing protein [Chitinophaga]ASZ14540.1 hypothetical protein CK934_28115 [Chitinophaga sp. MD30]UCJ07807.1 site-specific integrase [Chitinophaga pendula]